MEVGFILLRHVNSEKSNNYWQKSYNCIRNFYPENKIIIIDDNSKKEFLTDIELINTIIINSEFPGRGELLPYYYYSRNKWFDSAVIIHDSVFIKKKIDFSNVDRYKILWDFTHDWDQPNDETRIINYLDNKDELIKLHKNKKLWTGCYGCMTVINYHYLRFLDDRYKFKNILNAITNRYQRMSFERVIACILQCHEEATIIFGDIHNFYKGIITFDMIDNLDLPIVKFRPGR